MIDDKLVESYLDDTWRTPPSVRRLIGRFEHLEIAKSLGRLAAAGRIEKLEKPTLVPKHLRPGDVRKIEFYRRLQ